jgi:hypothetical protein
LLPRFEIYEQGGRPRGSMVVGGAVTLFGLLLGVVGTVLAVLAL